MKDVGDLASRPCEFEFSDMVPGVTASFSVTVSNEMLESFGVMSGDLNPLHTDIEYAGRFGHPSKVVYGMLTASFYSRLVGMHLPGRLALLQQIDTSFSAPVYVGDCLTVQGCVAAAHESVRQVEIRASVVNQDGKTVSRAKIKTGMYA